MPVASTQHVMAATRQWLRPVVHVLIRCGITWRDFAELAKNTFVEVATSEFGKRGRPTNVSRAAILTGLARREVRKQRDKVDAAPETLTGYVTKASLVLSAWHLDPEFLDIEGRPAALAIEGESGSFESLVRRCSGSDVPSSALLKELRAAGAVRRRTDGRVEALLRHYVPHAMDEQLIRLWGSVLADVATTYVHNLTRTGRVPPRFERAAVNDRIAKAALPEFRKYLELEGQQFLERVDVWLTAHEALDGAADEQVIRLGVGTYHIQD
jgi:hypothetical protein